MELEEKRQDKDKLYFNFLLAGRQKKATASNSTLMPLPHNRRAQTFFSAGFDYRSLIKKQVFYKYQRFPFTQSRSYF